MLLYILRLHKTRICFYKKKQKLFSTMNLLGCQRTQAHQPSLAARPRTYLLQTVSYDVSIQPRHLSVLSAVMFHRVSDMTSRRRLRSSTSHRVDLPPVHLSTVGKRRFRFRVPPSGTTCLSTSHLRRHSQFSDNDSRPFCFPIPTKTLSYDSCVTITIHHFTVWTPVVLAIIDII